MNKMRGLTAALGLTAAGLAGALVMGAVQAQAARSFADPLDTAAVQVARPTGKPLLALARSGTRIVGAGQRGVVAVSDDEGASWRQAVVPVQSDLTALSFADASQGWAVGHDGVILHTQDGGLNWSRQFDGRQAKDKFTAYYQQRLDAGDATAERQLQELARNYASGPALPYLDVHFSDAKVGYAVGSFGTIVATEDGGNTWLPVSDKVDNPEFLNLNAVRRIGASWYVVGEKGLVFKRSPGSDRFRRIATSYNGSFFGIAGSEQSLVVYGLRGTVYHSADAGETWTKVSLPVPAAVTGAAVLPDGRAVLVTAAGMVWVRAPGGAGFAPTGVQVMDMLTAVLPLGNDQLAVAGLRGVTVQRLTPKVSQAPVPPAKLAAAGQ